MACSTVIDGDFEAPSRPMPFAKLFNRGDVGQVLITKEHLKEDGSILMIRFMENGKLCTMVQKADTLPAETPEAREQLITSMFQEINSDTACEIVKKYLSET